MRIRIACYPIAILLFLSCAAAMAAEPVSTPCRITAMDARSGIVTATDTATKRTFQFKAPVSLLRSLKVGQQVHADFRTQKVTVDGATDALVMLKVRPAEPVGEPTASAQEMRAAGSNPLGGKRGLPPVKVGKENPGGQECTDRGGEWRCTTTSTGSSPGPEDDERTCACINP